ncbi:MAG: cell shape determination protein CcmA [Candidatus Marinimicrobia bacterium CG08_land_8_20_14_0_20_45_22]|nr:MAG: cell shape determination protein CcmA [Candidatus Marinimicrobia bacterium CG08_land_8_20_14_0_20_45_22]
MRGDSIIKKESTINTIIGENTLIAGKINCDGNIIVYGKIEGDITTEGTITIFATSNVQGNLTGFNVQISGKVEGNIDANGKVVLGEKSSLIGDIKAVQIVIEEGAAFDGRCVMRTANPESAASTKSDR